MAKDLILDIISLLREHEENRIEGETIDERHAERVGMAGRVIAAVRHHDGGQAVLLEPNGRPVHHEG